MPAAQSARHRQASSQDPRKVPEHGNDRREHRAECDCPGAPLVSVDGVAAMLGCSRRHVYRLSGAGRMPSPVKVGSLTRWRRKEIDNWIRKGCQPYGTTRSNSR